MNTSSSKHTLSLFMGIIVAALMSAPSFALAEYKSDNSKVNAKIENRQELNSQDQNNSKLDIRITSDIRREVVKQRNFSINAKNVKIITSSGLVVLKGPVKTEAEKRKIESIASSIAGADQVTSEITIAR